jgi:SAM-dependent methyltransferase
MTCYLCGSADNTLIVEAKDMRFECFGKDKQILKCRKCGLIQLTPPWTDEEIDKLYKDYWDKKDFDGHTRKIKISRYLTKYLNKSDRILEVGCGYGDNVIYLKSKGYTVIGIDKSMTSIGRVMDYKDWRDDVDAVYAIQLFEHLADPKRFVGWLKGKKFILEVPNTDDPLLQLKAFQKFYWYPYHLFFYTKKTIGRLFPTARVILRQEYGLINHLRWLVLGRPGNFNAHIPILDDIYKFILTRVFKVSDTLVVVGNV